MSTIRCVYSRAPSFPATDQHPDAARYTVAGHTVDAVGGEPTAEEVAAFLAPPPPASVTMRQARLALLQAGHLAAVTAALAATPGMAGEAARIEWEYASTLERDSPLVQAFAAQLGLTGADLDALFTAAAAL
jgi:hypothetical protein